MLNDVGKALDETAKSPQMQQAKTEVQKAAESLKFATEHTAQELRPLILDALRKLNDELARFAARMEPTSPAATESPAAEHEEAAEPAKKTKPEPASEPEK